jgi:hypothetical protein
MTLVVSRKHTHAHTTIHSYNHLFNKTHKMLSINGNSRTKDSKQQQPKSNQSVGIYHGIREIRENFKQSQRQQRDLGGRNGSCRSTKVQVATSDKVVPQSRGQRAVETVLTHLREDGFGVNVTITPPDTHIVLYLGVFAQNQWSVGDGLLLQQEKEFGGRVAERTKRKANQNELLWGGGW